MGDETLTGVHLPPPIPGERGAYVRAISRARAEWPLAEAAVRMLVEQGRIVLAAVAVGGVAPVPLRLPAVENALAGRPPTAAVLAEAGALADVGASPRPMTIYKGPLLVGVVVEALERASGHHTIA